MPEPIGARIILKVMRWRTVLWVVPALAAATGSGALGPIAFEEIADRTGLRFVTDSSPTPNKNQPETMVAGVGLIDYDNDGLLDVYLVNGAAIPSLEKNSPKFWNRLFHNNGNGTFSDVTERAGVKGAGYGMGVAIGDFDNDGWQDIFVANVTRNELLRNNHDGTFTDVTAKAGLSGAMFEGKKMWSISAGWFDYNNDGYLDLVISNYCRWEVNKDPFCGPNPSMRAYCHPKNYAPLPNTLYRNNGDGTFTDVSAETAIAPFYGKGMGVVFADYDHDGFTDVFVANDNAPNLLFHNLAGKKFEEVSLRVGVAYPESGAFISGMGADFRDIDNDGWDDIWHTAIEGESFPLFRNRGKGDFLETTDVAGIGNPTRDMSGWSNGVFDFDNDGWKDLFAARGNVQDTIDQVSLRKYAEPNAVFRNTGNGKFEDVSAQAGTALQGAAAHRGAAFGDLDNDGRVDAVVSVLNGSVKYLHNITQNGNHWLLLKLLGSKSNRMGLGAQVRVTAEDGKTQYNHATTSTGYACSSDPRVHFGLGAAKKVREVEITWPSGVRQTLRDVAADRIVTVTEK